jgi:hypothetical protein
MNRPFHVCAVYGFTFMAVGASGDLPSAGAGSDRSGRDFSSDAGTGKQVRRLPDA